MKKIVLSLTFFLLIANAFGQDQPALTKDDYLRKSKSQKTFAWILLGGGAGLAIAGLSLSDTYASDAGTWMAVGGGVLVAASIPLFISSSKNARKAESMTVAIGSQPIYLARLNSLALKKQPAIMLRFNF